MCPLCVGCVGQLMKPSTTLSALVHTAYKKCHDQVTKFIHWKVAQSYGFEVPDQWWLHRTESVLSNTACKLMWDFTIVADSPIAHQI